MTKPQLSAGLDIQAVRDALDRTRTRLSPEDHARLADAVEIVAEVLAVVSQSADNVSFDEDLFVQTIKRARESR